MSVSVRLEPAFVSVGPAATAEAVLHLRNAGEIVEAYHVELVGAPAEWGVVEPAELSLYPGTSGTVTARFSPPRGTRPEAGRYPFAVRAVPVERPEDVQVPEGVVEVLPEADLEAVLLARTRPGRLGARFQIAVRNAGNATSAIAVDAAEPDGKLRLRARPGSEDFSPGEEGHFRIRARPRRVMLKGRARTIPFRATVTVRAVLGPDGGEEDGMTAATVPAEETAQVAAPDTAPVPEAVSKTLDAVFEQRPLVPAGAGKVVAAVAAVAALCTAAWFLMVKPAVTSAATTTAGDVAASIAHQQSSADALAGAASASAHPGSPAAGGSASAPKTPTPSGTTTSVPATASTTSPSVAKPSPTSPSASPGVPSTTAAATTVTTTVTASGTATTPPGSTTAGFDTSLAVQVTPGQSGTATFTTPARDTFLITDYVLENPQGDYGTITVNVNGTQVSMLALEDFRDDDYPWVTPLSVPAGAHVTITVDCGAPGTPPHGIPPTTCSESALFNGTMTTAGR